MLKKRNFNKKIKSQKITWKIKLSKILNLKVILRYLKT